MKLAFEYHSLFDKRAYIPPGKFRAGWVIEDYLCGVVNTEFREVAYDKLCRVINNDICQIIFNDVRNIFNEEIHSFVWAIFRVFDDEFY